MSYLITKEGFEKLKNELLNLKNVERPRIIEAVATAREMGDLSENAEYQSAREEQRKIDRIIADLSDKVVKAEVIDVASLSGKTVRFGATVKLEDNDSERKITYKIVSDYEADIDSGLISIESPIARALIGKNEGDTVEIIAPGGVKNYEILEVKFI